MLIAFFAWLTSLLTQSTKFGWLPILAFAMFVVWGAASILGNAVWVAILEAGRSGSDPQVLATVRDVVQELSNASYLFFGFAMVVIGAVTFQSRALPAWLSWPAIVIGLGLAWPLTIAYAGLAQIVWTIVVTVRYLLLSPTRQSAAV